MHARVLVTDNGPHPVDVWAEITADHIIDSIKIEGDDVRKAKPRFKLDIIDAVEEHYGNVSKDERAALAVHGAKRYDHYDATTIRHMAHEHHAEHLDEAVKAVVDAAQKYPPFAAPFTLPQVQDAVKHIINDHMSHSMRVEHGWHKDLGKPFGH